jgi:predicted acyltransferase
LAVAALAVVVGLAWQWALPFNKKIWTPSYVMFTTGLATAAMALTAVVLDDRRVDNALVRGCEAFGRNALLVFALSGLVPRLLSLWRLPDPSGTTVGLTPLQWLYRHGFDPWFADPRLASLLYAVTLVLAYGVFARALDRRGLYWRA